jgi:processive 1,2-diacylglycerol beta-glucosyltransferase
MKILVIHATAGAGHKKAAEAIYNGIQRHTSHQVQLVDSLDYTNPFFKQSYPWTYVFMVTKLPQIWAFFFWMLDIPFLQPAIRLVRRCYNAINTQLLEKFLKKEKFDCIFTTHFMSAEVSSYLKRTKQIQSKVICVVTDFDVHHIWINKGTDIYTGACEFTKQKISSFGISSGQVFATGIPTDEKFGMVIDKRQMRQKLNINQEMFTVLIATGSFGMGPLAELIVLLKGYQLLVVCGHNKDLYERLKVNASSKVHIFGLVNNMDELMAAADAMVTKPGGLSIAESLVKKLPLIFFSAIPGQEMGNINVLKRYEVASDQGGLLDIVKKVDELSSHPEVNETLRRNIEVLAKPNAVKDIIKLI